MCSVRNIFYSNFVWFGYIISLKMKTINYKLIFNMKWEKILIFFLK